MTSVRRTPVGLAIMATLAGIAMAGVEEVADHGFAVSHEVTIAAPPDTVYEILVDRIGSWWNPAHTFSGDAGNMWIEPRPGGCFCEKLPDGGGVEHLRVVNVSPGRLLRMSGGLGPMQGAGLTGSLTWSLSEAGDGTRVELRYSAGGFLQGGFEKLAPAVDGVLGEQLDRLKLFVETGQPTRAEAR